MVSDMPIPATVVCGPTTTPLLGVAGAAFLSAFALRPHHELVETTGYVCFVPLISTYALVPGTRIVDPNFDALDLIPDHIRAAAAAGRCLLVLDSASEGDPLVAAGFAHLHGWLAAHGIPRQRVVLVNQNRLLGDLYAGSFGAGVRFLVYDSYIKGFLAKVVADDAVRAEIHALRAARPAPYAFLCMNGTPRPNRLLFAAALKRSGLLASCYWSMLGVASGKAEATVEAAMGYRDTIGATWVTDNDIEAIVALIPRIFRDETAQIAGLATANDLANHINPASFAITQGSLVTETEFSGGDVVRITEKTVKAASVGHPLVVAGNPGALRLLRELGFQSWGAVIDEGYDTLADAEARLRAVIAAAQQLRAVMAAREGADFAAMEAVCRHNEAHAAGPALGLYEATIEAALLQGIRAAVG